MENLDPQEQPISAAEEPETIPVSLPEEMSPAEMQPTESESEPAPAEETPAENAEPLPGFGAKAKVFFKRLLRWVVGLLVIFGLGFAAAYFLLYAPNIRHMKDAQQTASDLQGQMSEMQLQLAQAQSKQKQAESQSQDLQSALDNAHLETALYATLVDVTGAQLALAQDDVTSAKVALNLTPDTLTQLADLLGPDMAEISAAMQTRLTQVLSELDSDTYAAQSDLNVLANNLFQLTVQFASP